MSFHINDSIEVSEFCNELANLLLNEINLSLIDENIDSDELMNLKKVRTTVHNISNDTFDLHKNSFFIIYENNIAGFFEFHPDSREDHTEVGYWLFERYRRKNILSNVFPFMIEYAKKKFQKNRLLALTKIDNIPSINLLEKLKFKRTGRTLVYRDAKRIEYVFCLSKQAS